MQQDLSEFAIMITKLENKRLDMDNILSNFSCSPWLKHRFEKNN